MSFMKRVTIALMCVILVAGLIPCATGMAFAAPGEKVELTPPPDSPFPSASGWVSKSYAGPVWGYTWGGRYKYYVKVTSCQVSGLASNTWYRLHEDAQFAGYIVTDENGNGAWSNASRVARKEVTAVYDVRDDATDVVVLSSKR